MFYDMWHVSYAFKIFPVQVQNGIAIYATWTTIASLVNLNIVLITEAKMSQTDATTTSLSVLTAVVSVW